MQLNIILSYARTVFGSGDLFDPERNPHFLHLLTRFAKGLFESIYRFQCLCCWQSVPIAQSDVQIDKDGRTGANGTDGVDSGDPFWLIG